MTTPRETVSRDLAAIPGWAMVLAGLAWVGFVAGSAVFSWQTGSPAFWALCMGLFFGSLLALYIVGVGYVNRDARRRGMNTVLWTLLVIFVPNAIGFILYFLLRTPPPTRCPACGALASGGSRYCPQCGKPLVRLCANCGQALGPGDVHCTGCGQAVQA